MSTGCSWRPIDDAGLDRILEAIRVIRIHDPVRYRRMVKDVERIWVCTVSGSVAQFQRKTWMCQLDENFVDSESTTPELLASAIVHEATHARLFRMGFGYDETVRASVEGICLRRELAFAARIPGGIPTMGSGVPGVSARLPRCRRGVARRRKLSGRIPTNRRTGLAGQFCHRDRPVAAMAQTAKTHGDEARLASWSFWNSAVGLLIVTGGLLGLSLPFGKIATDAGVPGIVWAFVISLGAGGLLFVALLVKGGRPSLTSHKLRYFFITAAVSYALPNVLMFSAIPHLGAGYTGIMFTLSPVVTLVLSILLGVRRPNMLGVAGIAVGFAGAVMVAATRGEAGQPAALFWVAVGLLVPISLAVGNIYRTMDWPGGTGPIELAVGSHLASAALLLAGILALPGAGSLSLLAGVPLVVVGQMAAASAMFAFYFRLQAVGGPVYLSQIGYVAAAVGLFSGTLFLGESYGALTWIGALVICAGVALTTRAQRNGG